MQSALLGTLRSIYIFWQWQRWSLNRTGTEWECLVKGRTSRARCNSWTRSQSPKVFRKGHSNWPLFNSKARTVKVTIIWQTLHRSTFSGQCGSRTDGWLGLGLRAGFGDG